MKAIEAPKPYEIMRPDGPVFTREWYCFTCGSSNFVSGDATREQAVKHARTKGHTVSFARIESEIIFPLRTQ